MTVESPLMILQDLENDKLQMQMIWKRLQLPETSKENEYLKENMVK